MASTNSIFHRLISISFSKQILIGLALGLVLGLVFGEMIAPIRIIADGFIRLLQMTVLPFVTVSLITGLGSLTKQQGKMILTKVGGLLLLMWAITLVFVFLIPVAFPSQESASFFSTSLIDQPKSFDFLNLYIPTNPFFSLANSIVPAVVFFSIAVGIALIGIEHKEQLIGWLEIARKTLSVLSRFVVKLTPIGLFAIGANLAGTLRLADLERVQIFLLTYATIAVLMTLWVLPGLVTALTPIRYREILERTAEASITAFMAGDLFIVLPILVDASKELIRRHSTEQNEAANLPDVIVPASFNFPHSGKVLSLSFILFAAWFSDTTISLLDNTKLATTGLLTFFGNLTVAVPYLLDFFHIPIDTFQLFLATGVINSRFGSAIAAMHTLALAVLGAFAMTNTLTIKPNKLIRYAIITVFLTFFSLIGLRFFFGLIVDSSYRKGEVLGSMHLLKSKDVATVYRDSNQAPPFQESKAASLLDQIDERKKLRVGYLPNSLPYAFFNAKNELVGFDIDMAHQLAKEMNVSLEFVQMDRTKIIDQLKNGYCDILMSGFAVSTSRARQLALSSPYLNENAAFIVPDFRRHDFASRDSILSIQHLRIGVPDIPYYKDKAREYAPNAQVVTIDSPLDLFEGRRKDFDVLLLSAQRGSSWCLLYPQFTVVVPQPGMLTVPIAYAVARNDQNFAAFVNTWIELKKNDRTIDDLYDYWILGKNAEPQQPRWSILRNVLHWVN